MLSDLSFVVDVLHFQVKFNVLGVVPIKKRVKRKKLTFNSNKHIRFECFRQPLSHGCLGLRKFVVFQTNHLLAIKLMVIVSNFAN
jgi:hypothetical protein